MTDRNEAASSAEEIRGPAQLDGEIGELEKRVIAIEQLQDLISELVSMALMTSEEMKISQIQTTLNATLARIAMNFANSSYAFTPVDKQNVIKLTDTLVRHPAQIITRTLELYLDLEGRLSEESTEMDRMLSERHKINERFARKLYERLHEFIVTEDKDLLLEACVLTASYKWNVQHRPNHSEQSETLLALCDDIEEYLKENIFTREEDFDMNEIVLICSNIEETFGF